MSIPVEKYNTQDSNDITISESNFYASNSPDIDLFIEENQVLHKVSSTRFFLIFIGLSLCFFITYLDDTILSTVLATIGKEFKDMSKITWVSASYLLTRAATIPLYGKMSDIFGRRIMLVISLVLFMIGSLVCGLSTNIETLIVFRAVTGIGGGGLNTLSLVVVADLVQPHKRGIYLGIFTVICAIAFVLGPILGGILADSVSWRWAFYINIPICIISILLISTLFNIPAPSGDIWYKLKRVDILGAIVLMAAISILILALNWGGNTYEWTSLTIILCLCLALLLFVCFVIVEWKFSIEPIISGEILNRNVISCCFISFFLGFTLISTVYYIPLYYQNVEGHTATRAGLELIPFLLGIIVMSGLSGIFITKTGSYKPLILVGTFSMLLGNCLMASLMRPDISRAEQIGYLTILGIGVGLCFQTLITIVQGSVLPKQVATATSINGFSILLGDCVGIAIVGAVFINKFKGDIHEKLPEIDVNQVLKSYESMSKLTLDQLATIRASYTEGIRFIYMTLIVFSSLAFIAQLNLRNAPLTGHK